MMEPRELLLFARRGKLARMPIRIIKHEAVPDCGSFEVRFSDGRPSVYFCWDDIPGRRLSAELTDSNRALQAAKDLARGERDKEHRYKKRPQRGGELGPF